MKVKRDGLERIVETEIRDFQPFSSPHLRLGRIDLAYFSSHHVLHDCSAIGVAALQGSNMVTITEYGDGVSDLKDFVQFMRDEDDAGPLRSEPGEKLKQTLHICALECRGGLVENQHFRLQGRRFQDLDDLLLCEIEVADKRISWDGKGELAKVVIGKLVQQSVIDQPKRTRLAIRGNIFGDRKVIAETQFMEDRTDSEAPRSLWRLRVDFDSLKQDVSLFLPVNAGKDLHQRRFPRTVFSDKGMDFSSIETERSASKCLG